MNILSIIFFIAGAAAMGNGQVALGILAWVVAVQAWGDA